MRLPRLFAAALVAALLLATAPAALAGPPGDWTRVSTGEISSLDEPGLYRAPDGTLYVAYHRKVGSNASYGVTRVKPSGATLDQATAAGNWATLTRDPKIVQDSGNLRLIFGGLQDTNSTNYFSQGYMYNAVSAPGASSWSVPAESYSTNASGYNSYGTGVTTYGPSATPVVAWPHGSTLTWAAGTGGAASSFTSSQCCLYDVTLASAGGAVYAAWYENGSTAGTRGVFVRQILPSLGAITKAPHSSVAYDSSVANDSSDPYQSIAMTSPSGGGVQLAYCVGYPGCTYVGLWKLGATGVRRVPGSKGSHAIALSSTPSGRLWVAWGDGAHELRAVRTNASGTAFGAVRNLGRPAGSSFLYKAVIDGGPGPASVVVNTGTAMFHQQVLPGLALRASPSSWARNTRKKVTFTVTDAGSRIGGSTVKAAGKSCTTSGHGTCSIVFRPSARSKRFAATARHGGYAAGNVRLRIG